MHRSPRPLIFAAAIILFALAGISPAKAQMALNLNRLIPTHALDAATPDARERQNYADAGPMSDEEVQAFLTRPRNWFRSIGAGGSPYTKPVALDAFAKVLSDEDEKAYREAFRLIGQGKLHEAALAAGEAKDDVLMGHVQAALLLANKHAAYAELQGWMEKNNALPEAGDVYERASKVKEKGAQQCLKPNAATGFGGNVEHADGGGNLAWEGEGLISAVPQAKRAEFTKVMKKDKAEDVQAWLDAEKQAGHLDDASVTAAIFAYSENLMRRGQSAKAWPFLKTADAAKANFSANALAYAQWIKGLVAWVAKDYPASYASFSALTEAKDLPGPNRAAASFWAARAADRVGHKEDATKFIELAAKYPRSFYGILAVSHNNAAPEYNWTMPGFDAGQAQEIKNTPAGKRALALLQLDERVMAEAELRNLEGHDGIYPALLALANRYGLPSLAMQVGSVVGQGRYDAALYPLMPWQPAGGYASDPALVLAVAKNESHFNHIARSPKGAAGLMQVMPQTAEHVRVGASRNLYDPEVNVTLGDRYLDMLTRTPGVKDNLLLLIGSYNCGSESLVRLHDASIKQNGDDALLFIETLPIKETRDYMQKVMATYWVYRARFNKPLTAMAELAIGRWPHYRPNDMKQTASATSY